MLLHTHFIDEEAKVSALSDLPKLVVGGGSMLPSEGLLAFSERLLGQIREWRETGIGEIRCSDGRYQSA